MNNKLVTFFHAIIISLLFTNVAAAQTADGALATVKKAVSVVLTDIKAHKAEYVKNTAALDRMIDKKILPYFDVDAMAKLALAKNWKSATPEQRKTFLEEFKTSIMRTYSSRLLDYDNSTVEYGQLGKVKRKRIKIDTTVINNNDGKRYPLTLSMGYRNGAWKIYDVSMDGTSLIIAFRTSIGEDVSSKGLQAVIDEMKERNAKGETLD